MLKISLLLIYLKNNKYNFMKYKFYNAPPLFCTFAWQRSGTKFLGSCLRNGTDIFPAGEIFNPDSNGLINYYNWAKNKQEINNVDIVSEEGLDQFFSQVLLDFGISHFDVMLNQLIGISPKWDVVGVAPFLTEHIKSRGYWVVLLTRSTAATFLSSELLKLSNQPHQLDYGNTWKPEKFYVDLNQYILHHKKVEYFYDLIRTNFADYPRYMELSFNNLVGKRNGLLPVNLTDFFSMGIKDYYGVDHYTNIQIKASLLGMSPFNPKEYIVNYKEINEMYAVYDRIKKSP